MQVTHLDIPEVILIEPMRHTDDRGFFSETYNALAFADAGIDAVFVQDNHSLSRDVGVLRGLHYQVPRYEQGKLVRVIRGRIFDVAVDIRIGSPTYGDYVYAELSADNWRQLWIPSGFAHGFCTLEHDTEVVYKVTNFYNKASDRSIRYDDPEIGIDWPVAVNDLILSDKDRSAPLLEDSEQAFTYLAS